MSQKKTLMLAGILGAAALLAGMFLKDDRTARAVLAAGLAVQIGLWVMNAFWRERELGRLVDYLTRLQDRLELPGLEYDREGNLGILQSELYKLMTLLREQSDSALREKKYLAEMLSNISHQLKTPLTAVAIMTDLLKKPGLPEEKRREFAGKIDSQISQMTWLIRTLLTLSRLEAGVLTLKTEEVAPLELIRRAAEPLKIMAELKGVTLRLPSDSGEQEESSLHCLLCDGHWSGEALTNMMKNCIEHTPPGGEVWVRLGQSNFSTDILIGDNGEGIPEKDLPHIFERFYQSGKSGRDSVGIGLALSRQIVMMQNGTIEVESRRGEGTRFLVRFYRREQ